MSETNGETVFVRRSACASAIRAPRTPTTRRGSVSIAVDAIADALELIKTGRIIHARDRLDKALMTVTRDVQTGAIQWVSAETTI